MSKNEDSPQEKREILTEPERIELKRTNNGVSTLRVPAAWRKLKALGTQPLVFEGTLERDSKGNIFIVFHKVQEEVKG